MRRHAWRGLAIGTCLLALVAACAGPAAPAAAPAAAPPAAAPNAAPAPGGAGNAAPPAPVEHLRAAYTSLGMTQAFMWVAQDAGYYRDEGLDVELEYIPGSNVAIQGMMSGDLQFMIAGGATTAGVTLGGGDAVLLATMIGTFVINIIGQPDLAPTADGVRGHTLAVTRLGSTSDFVARYWLKQLGLEPVADVPIIQVGGNPEMVAALATGAADMVAATDLFALELQRQGYRELVNGASLGVEYIHAGLGARQSYIAGHEDVVRRFLRASFRGQGRFVNDRDFAVQVTRKYAQLDDQDVLNRAWELHTSKYIKRIPYTTSAAMRLTLEELAGSNEAARGADPEQFYDNRFVRELDDAGFFKALYPQ
ncbi:MAG TPA: ABC transporter substrate-binding protein [Chloroflexota bacterium]|nr:ABC transporter substrate-binding protein [Chloroflexota bacterium]